MTDAAPTIRFIDLQTQQARLQPRLSRAIEELLASGAFVGGQKVAEAEDRLAAFCGAAHCIACANGTDALILVLKAWDVGQGDAVYVPAFTFAASAGAVVAVGATPVFVDVDEETFNMDPASLAAAIPASRELGLRPAVVLPVDMFGQPADHAAIAAIAKVEGLRILCDAAQSFGAAREGRAVGTFGHATTTSFYPAKPLGCYGDGGAIFTQDAELAACLRSIREHGQGTHRYEHVRPGINSRLDAIQAAVIVEKLEIFAEELRLRQQVADTYANGLSRHVDVPRLAPGSTSSWAQFTLRSAHRDAIAATCREHGVPTAIHYPIALSRQPAYRMHPSAPARTPTAERLAANVISLPMHPYLDRPAQDHIIDTVLSALRQAPARRAV